jgi:hypothetical protein
MSKQTVRKGAVKRQPDKKGLGFQAVAALIGFGIVAGMELVANQEYLMMKPAVDKIYGSGLTNTLAAISSWTVAGALFAMSLGLAKKLNYRHAVAGFALMAVAYAILGIFAPGGIIALVLVALVGVFSVVVAFVRHAAKQVAPKKAFAANFIVSGCMMLIGVVVAPPLVNWCGSVFGARLTSIGTAVVLAIAFPLSLRLFQKYQMSEEETQAIATKPSWTPLSRRATFVNFLSAVSIGAAFGPLSAEIAHRSLNTSWWMGVWGFGAGVTGFFLMAVLPWIAGGLRDRGLLPAALITLLGGAYMVIERNHMGGMPLLAGSLLVNLGANAFEPAVYELEIGPAENIATNFGRALGFGVGAYFSLLFLDGTQYSWLVFGSAAGGALATYMMRKHWDQSPKNDLTLRSARVKIALILVGGAAVMAGAVVLSVRYIINWFSTIGARLNQAEEQATLAEARLNLAEERATLTEARLRQVQSDLAWTREITGLDAVENGVKTALRQLNKGLDKISNIVEERSEYLKEILATAEALITAEDPTAEGLLEADKNLQRVKSQIASTRESFIDDAGVGHESALTHHLQQGFVTLAVLDQPLLHDWAEKQRTGMKKAASTTRQYIDAELTALQNQVSGLEAQRTEVMRRLRDDLRARNTVDNRNVRGRRADIKALNEVLGED